MSPWHSLVPVVGDQDRSMQVNVAKWIDEIHDEILQGRQSCAMARMDSVQIVGPEFDAMPVWAWEMRAS